MCMRTQSCFLTVHLLACSSAKVLASPVAQRIWLERSGSPSALHVACCHQKLKCSVRVSGSRCSSSGERSSCASTGPTTTRLLCTVAMGARSTLTGTFLPKPSTFVTPHYCVAQVRSQECCPAYMTSRARSLALASARSLSLVCVGVCVCVCVCLFALACVRVCVCVCVLPYVYVCVTYAAD